MLILLIFFYYYHNSSIITTRLKKKKILNMLIMWLETKMKVWHPWLVTGSVNRTRGTPHPPSPPLYNPPYKIKVHGVGGKIGHFALMGRICFPRLKYWRQRWLLFIGCKILDVFSFLHFENYVFSKITQPHP